ncbi:MAG: helix-turn-helix domain-containing protein [Beijerinckiaceae bacterium]|nr:helix-turn-helix domain-containing protein [Beijerinckiaceae bacterium]
MKKAATGDALIEWRQKVELDDQIRARTDLTPTARLVASALLSHFNTKTGQCNPSYPRLQQSAGCSRSAVRDGIKLLDEKGVIVRMNIGDGAKSTWYRFPALSPDNGQKPLNDGVEKEHVSRNDTSRNSTQHVSEIHQKGVEKASLECREKTPNQELTMKQNQETNPDRWIGFYRDLGRVFRQSGYCRIPTENDRVARWKQLGYRPEVCLATIGNAIIGKKDIVALSWFDKPLAKAHSDLAAGVGASAPVDKVYVPENSPHWPYYRDKWVHEYGSDPKPVAGGKLFPREWGEPKQTGEG